MIESSKSCWKLKHRDLFLSPFPSLFCHPIMARQKLLFIIEYASCRSDKHELEQPFVLLSQNIIENRASEKYYLFAKVFEIAIRLKRKASSVSRFRLPIFWVNMKGVTWHYVQKIRISWIFHSLWKS